ncbi:MAG: aminotransferase class I/II-fold pyridoxal phosphate-dependent enzyme [Crocinitomicaceae bacterium]
MANKLISSIYDHIQSGIDRNVLHLKNSPLGIVDGRVLQINDASLLNFSSYSYLGLEVDPRVKEGGASAIRKYGSQFGSSRAFVALDIYEEMEGLLSQIFETPVVVAPSTTLAHQAALPVIIGDNDAIILDQQVHASVKTTVDMLKPKGITVEILRHNRMDLLEERIKQLKTKYDRIWYMCDGVYSMYGDFAPVKFLEQLMIDHDQFHVYIDDAHGMSWTGKNGRGYVLDQIDHHPQMILVTSLNKAFAGAGGVIATVSKKWYREIKTCGGTLIFSTPIQPPMLGVDIAVAKIHLSEEINELQNYFKRRIKFCTMRLKELGLPDISEESPVFYIATGTPKVTFNLVQKMIDSGYYMSPAIFPAVGSMQSGIRFCVNVNHSLNDIDNMLYTLKEHFESAFREEGADLAKLPRYFPALKGQTFPSTVSKSPNELNLMEHRSIKEVDREDWDTFFKGKGSFDWDGMKFLESVYGNRELPEDNWDFYYYIVKDADNKVVLATFFTSTLAKEDTFSKKSRSMVIEEKRKQDPYMMTSKILTMGSMLTEGDHLYLNQESPFWKRALTEVLDTALNLKNQISAKQLILRDFRESHMIQSYLLEEGYVKVDLPHANIIEKDALQWSKDAEFRRSLSSNDRRKLKKVFEHKSCFEVSFANHLSSEELDEWYELYLNIQSKSLEINTFPIPKEFIEIAVVHPNWEAMRISIKAEHNGGKEKVVAFGLTYRSNDSFSPMVLGIDYKFVESHGLYRQAIFQLVKRASHQNIERIHMGFTADIEKRRFGAIQQPRVAFALIDDTYTMQVIEANVSLEHI